MVADSIQVASQLTLKQEDYPGLFRWAQSNTEVHKSGKVGQKRETQRDASVMIWSNIKSKDLAFENQRRRP